MKQRHDGMDEMWSPDRYIFKENTNKIGFS